MPHRDCNLIDCVYIGLDGSFITKIEITIEALLLFLKKKE